MKQYDPIFSTDRGMQIHSSDEQFENADEPSIERCESRSNVTAERHSQSSKQEVPNSLIDDGTWIERSEAHD
jgi:hypothetical protein